MKRTREHLGKLQHMSQPREVIQVLQAIEGPPRLGQLGAKVGKLPHKVGPRSPPLLSPPNTEGWLCVLLLEVRSR
jgi:hypothetical protein